MPEFDSRPKSNGRAFEAIIADQCRRFFPEATIERNQRIRGQTSGVLREIDILVRQKIGPQEILLVIDCKDHRRSVDVKTMEAFCGLKNDVGANAGILVSRAGFTKSALKVANKNLVTPYQFADEKMAHWPDWIWIAVVLDLWLLTPTSLGMTMPDGTEKPIASDEELVLTDVNTGKNESVATIMRRLWERHDPKVEGPIGFTVKGKRTGVSGDHSIHFGFKAERFHAFRKGKLVFSGLADPLKQTAYSDTYTIALAELPMRLRDDNDSPTRLGKGLGMELSSTLVKTSDRTAEAMLKLLLNGYVELQIKTKDPFEWSLPDIPDPIKNAKNDSSRKKKSRQALKLGG